MRTPGSGYFVKVAEPRLRWRGRSRFSYPRCGSLAGLAVRCCSGGMTVFSDSGRRVPAAHGELLVQPVDGESSREEYYGPRHRSQRLL